MTDRYRLYVGVDYGTTFSGFSYVASRDVSIHNIDVVTDWPGNAAGYREKVPSQIAYKSENTKLDKDVWGYEIPPSVKSHCWTKLLLDKDARLTEFDDPSLSDMPQLDGLSIREGNKSVEEVVTDFLSHLYRHCMEYLEKRMTEAVLKVTPIDFWFTIPAIWSDVAQHTTKSAAEKAGFGKRVGREQDSISMITEPEAAAIASLKITADKFDDLLKIKTGILVCDCGGGTVDITSYTITALTPSLKLEESCVGIGGKCGATFVDRNLDNLLSRRYGTHYTSLPMSKRGPGSSFMKNFEYIKNDFDGYNNTSTTIQLIMKGLEEGDPNCVQYDVDDGEVTLTRKDMQECFDPVMKSIIALIEKQKAAVEKEGAPSIKNLVLVGGFGSSPYVWNRIKEWCGNDIRAICPDRPWSAIARGAALRGLEGAIVTKRRCRRHYGTILGQPFDPKVEVRDSRVYYHKLRGMDYRAGWMNWQISKVGGYQAMRRMIKWYTLRKRSSMGGTLRDHRIIKKNMFKAMVIDRGGPAQILRVASINDLLGSKLYPGEKKILKYSKMYREGSTKVFNLKLFSCSLDDPPKRDDDPNAHIEEVGIVRGDFTQVDLSKAYRKKFKKAGSMFSKDKWYELDMTCEISVADEVGLLQFVVKCEGEPCGSTTLVYQHE